LYGDLYLSAPRARPLVICNFVSTLDGLVSLAEPGHEAAGEISGFNRHDRMAMGLLRALADVVIVGAGTLRVEPDHLWTAEYIFPELRDVYAELRRALRKPEPPLNVVVSASGQVDPRARVFTSAEVPALVVTTPKGAGVLRDVAVPLARSRASGELSARTILSEALKRRPAKIVLVEGGPHLLGDFYAEHCIDQQFLTLAPQIAGRDHAHERPSLVMGKTFAPRRPLWTELLGVKRGDNHLFLRYQIAR
jgi:riboflavin biosynthesis pyrimidine reductase